MSALLFCLFVASAAFAIYSIVRSLRDYYPQVHELLNGSSCQTNSYAVWPTRLRLSEEVITRLPPKPFRRRPKSFARKANWRPAANGLPRVTRRLRYAVAPERVIVLS